MSNDIFPSLKGRSWNIKKTVDWGTGPIIQVSQSGKERRQNQWTYPIWRFALPHEFLIDDKTASGDVQSIIGFFNDHYATFEDWLYLDPDDNTVADQGIGTGDGNTRTFQLLRSYGTFIEPVKGIAAAPTIKVSDLTTTNFTWDNYGAIIFDDAPGLGEPITWSGSYYYRCRFEMNGIELTEMYNKVYKLDKCEFRTLK